MSLDLCDVPDSIGSKLSDEPLVKTVTDVSPPVLLTAAWHSLIWLVIANAVGVLIATLLVVPRLNGLLGEWTYGRWLPVHMNLQLYGWCSLPLVAFLFSTYGADRAGTAKWCRPALWLWSTSLFVGSLSWLNGYSSGKLFLDWSGYSRVLFPFALLALWSLLTCAYYLRSHSPSNVPLLVKGTKVTGLILLLAIPIALYVAADPSLYPPINPDTGGPTGASQLESVLIIIAILLLLPLGLSKPKTARSRLRTVAWCIFAAESLLCIGLGRADVSHYRPTQYISLGSLLVWLLLIPAYIGTFDWNPNTRRWRIAFLCWWSVLVPTGWCLFLPGVLDRFKFTDGLVAHSLLAMAGFVSSLLIFVLVQLLGEDGWIFNGTWSFYVWQGSVLAYVLVMFYAGWLEGVNPAFSILPGVARNTIYLIRLILGVLMLGASTVWLIDGTRALQSHAVPRAQLAPGDAR
jgi:cytochrome c oxidase cbb3-type subunit 1